MSFTLPEKVARGSEEAKALYLEYLVAQQELSKGPGYVSGRWYLPPYPAGFAPGSAPSANSIRLQPLILQRDVTITALAAKVTTAAAGGNFQLAIYANDPVTMRPTGPALASTASISCAATGNFSAVLAAPVTLPAGFYWMAINQDNSSAVYLTSLNSANGGLASLFGSDTLANIGGATTPKVGLNTPQTFGTWPSLAAATYTEAPGISADAAIIFRAQ